MKKKLLGTLMCCVMVHALFGQVCGDANGDGAVDIVDSLVIGHYSVGLNPQLDLSVCDVYHDGLVDIRDALVIAQYDVGLVTQLSGCSPTPTPTPTPTTVLPPEFEPDTREVKMNVMDQYASEDPYDTAQLRIFQTGCDSHFPMSGGSWGSRSYTIAGTATNGVDYTLLEGIVCFPAPDCFGQYPQLTPDDPIEYIVIEPIADNLSEGRETVILDFGGGMVAELYIDDVSTPTPEPL